jgi:hypothetical protein
MTNPNPAWNIFSRELDKILHVREVRLGQLDDKGMHLHPQLVRRLQLSLKYPKPLVVLNPEDLDRLVAFYHLTPAEHRRLKAALLALAVERMLMDRMKNSLALMVAESAFDTFLKALEANPDMEGIIRDGTFLPATLAPSGDPMEDALDRVGQAMLELNLASQTAPEAQRQAVDHAADAFANALDALARCPEEVRQSETWQCWQAEAERGMAQIQRLRAGGA